MKSVFNTKEFSELASYFEKVGLDLKDHFESIGPERIGKFNYNKYIKDLYAKTDFKKDKNKCQTHTLQLP